jgi:hypothetical protein
MRTFDLFNTLTTSRYNTNAGEVPVEQHIPIAENIAKVQPGDIIVSDYHTPEKAQRILTEVCHLSNQLICTEDGKATGKVWQSVKSEHHLGDNIHTDFNSPRSHGIPADLTTLWQLTEREKACGDLGWAMREARLTTWHADPAIRALQLHQIERNFPFLLKVAHLLDAKMKAEGFTRLLLCSRDCYLLHQLMARLFAGSYEIEYFYTSRLTRYRPDGRYATYAKDKLAGNTLIVDMNGSGNSLKYLTDMFGGTPLLVCGFGNAVPFLVAGGIRETSNLAPHAMVWGINLYAEGEWEPVFVNPAGIDWEKPEILESHKAFMACRPRRHPSVVPAYSLDSALAAMENPALAPLWADHLADSTAAYELLNSGPLPHAVIL